MVEKPRQSLPLLIFKYVVLIKVYNMYYEQRFSPLFLLVSGSAQTQRH